MECPRPINFCTESDHIQHWMFIGESSVSQILFHHINMYRNLAHIFTKKTNKLLNNSKDVHILHCTLV